MKAKKTIISLLCFVVLFTTLLQPASSVSNDSTQVWLTTIDQTNLLTRQNDIPLSYDKSGEKYEFNILEDRKYQEMDGFGASFTDASAWLVYNKLTPEARDELMKKLFDKEEGIGISFLRQPMGASDSALKMYSYDDMPKGKKDYELKNFSIDHDKEYIIPILKQALSINKDIKIMASPWSPPGWMKSTDNMIRGLLNKKAHSAFANYFVKFINAYENEGIPIYAISLQNEPYYEPNYYPGMILPPEEAALIIKKYLGPAFVKNDIDTKIITWDHNWDIPDYPETVLSDREASKYVAGSAWHVYGGTPEAMTEFHKKFPKKDIWFTEASGGEWVPPFHDAFMGNMYVIIRSARNWSKSVVFWNMALDENNGPTVTPESTLRGIVTINQKDGSIDYTVDYYSMGHISKFVDPGAYRIYCKSYINDLEAVAFKNPDGSKAMILSNRTKKAKTFKVNCGGKSFRYTLPEEAAVTFKW